MSTPQPGTQIPKMDGVGYAGASANYSREDHVHPNDDSKADIISPNFIGTPTAPTAAVGTASTQLATTAFVVNAINQNNNQQLPNKQNILIAGRNITLTPQLDGTVLIEGVDMTAMWDEVATKQAQLNAGSNITLHEEPDGTTTISATGGGGLQYFHETSESLYGEQTFSTPKWSCLDGYYFDFAVEDHVGINDPSEHSLIAKANDTPAIICAAITNSSGHFSNYYVGGIFFISKSPEGTAYKFTRNGNTYNGGYSEGDKYLDGIDANMVETYTYDGETWYIAVFGSLGLAGGGYPQDGNILHPTGIGGDTKNIHTVAGEIFALVDPYNITKYYAGLHQGDNLAFFAGGLDSNGTDAPIKIFNDGTSQGLGTEVEANPSGTATESLDKLNVDGTIYRVAGASAVSDLTDVNLTNLSDGEILKYDATNQEWVNASESGGGSALILNACKYSTDEQVVGIWTDGKPLYQKTIHIPSVTKSSWGSYSFGIENAIVHDLKGYILTNNDVRWTINYYQSSTYFSVYFSNSSVTIYWNYGNASSAEAEVTILYTKTTDSAGSGGYQAYGFSPIIYSEEEREVGVWIDNKPLYAKTYKLSSIIRLNNNGTDITSYITNESTIEKTVNAYAYDDRSASESFSAIWVGRGSNNALMAYCAEAGDFNIITLWYTKSTDTSGSGDYNTLGIPNVHYDGEEKVIGTWFGETLYEKSYRFTNVPQGSNTYSAPITNLNKVVNQFGTFDRTMSTGVWTYNINSQNEINLETRFDMLCRYRNQEQEIYIEVGSVYAPIPEIRFTIQYTKSSS